MIASVVLFIGSLLPDLKGFKLSPYPVRKKDK